MPSTQAVLYLAGLLVGAARTLFGVADYALWAVLLVMLARIVARPRSREGSAYMVSPQTFLILVGFMASLCGYIVLLAQIDLGTVELL